MTLKELDIVDFKNIAEATLSFSSGLNGFVGNNGEGKTNVLDAIHYLSVCKSFFNVQDALNIRHEAPFFVIQGKYETPDGEDLDIYCGVKRGEKKVFRKNGKPYERLSEHIGLLPLVMISPEDIALIEGGSEERRRLIDGIISQCDRDYLYRLISYNRTLLQRNRLLRSCEGRVPAADHLAVWDDRLAGLGEEISRRRVSFLEEFKVAFQEYYNRIADGREQVELAYRPSAKEMPLREALQRYVDRDAQYGFTTVGIHRDDIAMRMDGYEVKKVGSQGQKKTYLTALKLAQYVWLAKSGGKKPLLLLDDIFDKLDAARVGQIVRLVGDEAFGQVFITDTDADRLVRALRAGRKDYRIFRVERGKFTTFVAE